jgi:hypothetical protein
VPAAEAADAVGPSAVPTVISGEEEAARVVAADVIGTVVSSAVIEGILGKWGVLQNADVTSEHCEADGPKHFLHNLFIWPVKIFSQI